MAKKPNCVNQVASNLAQARLAPPVYGWGSVRCEGPACERSPGYRPLDQTELYAPPRFFSTGRHRDEQFPAGDVYGGVPDRENGGRFVLGCLFAFRQSGNDPGLELAFQSFATINAAGIPIELRHPEIAVAILQSLPCRHRPAQCQCTVFCRD